MKNKKCMNCSSENIIQTSFTFRASYNPTFSGHWNPECANIYHVDRDFQCQKCGARTSIIYDTVEKENFDA